MSPPVSERECRDYLGDDIPSLPIGTIEVFKQWIDLGNPLGVDTDCVPERACHKQTLSLRKPVLGRSRNIRPRFFIG